MATVYCLHCIYLCVRGGVYYCGNKCCYTYGGHSVTPDSPKYCEYFKQR